MSQYSFAAAWPMIGFGQVRHTRLRPSRHDFAYATFFLLLPMRSLGMEPQRAGALALNRSGWLSFHDRDHGDGRSPEEGGALGWLEEVLLGHGIDDADGEIWLHCYPRMFGYTFKPVSFWYCHRLDGRLRAIVVEVNNTFGERHCYLLEEPEYGQTLAAGKDFYVSPFCAVQGGYRFEFRRSGPLGLAETSVRVDLDDAQGPLVLTGISGRLERLTPAARRRALWRYPLQPMAVIWRIHWQALRLWLKRVPLQPRPAPPRRFVSRSPWNR